MLKNIKTQKIYTFPDMQLYGEFCILSLIELKLKIIKGEITEQLCYVDEVDNMTYVFDEFSNPEYCTDGYIETLQSKLLKELLTEQVKKRKSKRNF